MGVAEKCLHLGLFSGLMVLEGKRMEWVIVKPQTPESQFLIWESQSLMKIMRCEHCVLRSMPDQKEFGLPSEISSFLALGRTQFQ